MRTSTTRLLLMVSLVVLVLGVASQGQAQTVVKCTVPFDFSLGGQVFPSGDYTFTVRDGSGSRIVQANNWAANQTRFFIVDTEDGAVPSQTSITFNRYGNHYLLSSVSIAGDSIRLNVTPTRGEREMMVRARGDVVTVMASR